MLCGRGLPPTKQMIRNFAAQIAGKEPGTNWVDRFIKRHNIELVNRWTAPIDNQRHRADSAFKYKLYFKLLSDKITQYDVETRNIYNMDEKGFLIGILTKMKRVFTRQRYEAGLRQQVIQDGNREWITTIACICADGSALRPALIYQAASNKIQDTWLQDFDPAIHETFFTSSPSGWTNNDLGLAWLKQVFNRETKAKARRSYRLLILDGHGSHVTMDFIKYCDENRILLAILPPHSTHTLQPLDVALFKPLSTAYTTELSNFMYNCQGISSITKRDFYQLFHRAWHTAFTKSNIEAGFKATGLSPLNAEVVLKKFKLEDVERPSSSESTTSVLSASDWRKIERLLRQVVEDVYDSRSRQLSQTIHTIATQKQLLQHENEKLREALINEKKRRTRGKPLLLEAPQEYNGGAVFWSPTKVQEARDRQARKDADDKALQLQKSEEQKAKELQKQEKQAMLKERARLRLVAKEIRLQQQQAKAAEREEARITKQVEKQLRYDVQSSKKATQQSAKASSLLMAPPTAPKAVVVDEVPINNIGPSVPRETRTRKVQLPQRYRM
jgi:hypothetical protein